MFKDYDKYLSTSLKVYLFVLFFVFILKLMGLDYFGIDINNTIYLKFNDFILNHKLENIYYGFTIVFYQYMFVSLTINDNSKKTKIYSLCTSIGAILIKILDVYIANSLIIAIVDFIYLYVVCIIPNRKYKLKEFTIRFVKVYLLNTLFQLISLYLRNINYHNINLSFIIRTILDLDYILMMIIYYKLYFIEGGVKICGVEVLLSLLKKLNLKNLLQQFQRNLHNFKQKSKQEKLAISIYIVLSLLWNTISLIIILFVANLNHTFVECVFILTSFWLSKHTFGKPFHLSSMAQCFVISNVTYYVLNKITTPLGISLLVPIMLGVGLSYITSKFVKKLRKPLYRGMSKELFDETISKLLDKGSIKYKICYDYFVLKQSVMYLSLKYNYSDSGIKKIKDRVNKELEKLI